VIGNPKGDRLNPAHVHQDQHLLDILHIHDILHDILLLLVIVLQHLVLHAPHELLHELPKENLEAQRYGTDPERMTYRDDDLQG
jgi:hypothetical protein